MVRDNGIGLIVHAHVPGSHRTHVSRLLDPGGASYETKLWVTAFPWGESPAAHGLDPPYDLVLAADCIYDVKQVEIFLQSLRCACVLGLVYSVQSCVVGVVVVLVKLNTPSNSIIDRDVCGPKTTVLVGNEERDTSLQKFFVGELTKHFTVKPVKRKKLCELAGYHDLIELWVCKLRRPKAQTGAEQDEEQQGPNEN